MNKVATLVPAALLLASTLSPSAPAFAQGAARRLPAAVAVEVVDARGLPVRSANGVLVPDGVVVQSSALLGGAEVRVKSRTGDQWTARNVISASPVIGLALLELPDRPAYAVEYPPSGAFRSGSTVSVLAGPGAGPDSLASTVHYVFALRDGVDYAPLDPPGPSGGPVFDQTGRFLGVAVDLTSADIPVGIMVPVASVRTLSSGKGAPVPISSTSPQAVPAFEGVDNLTGLLFRGACLVAAGRTEDARAFLDLALKRTPDSADARFWKGRLLFVEKQYTDAAAEFVAAGKADQSFYLAWHMAGAAQNQAGNYLDAEAMYKKALEVNPRAADTYCNLGGAYFNQRRYELAIDAFEKSIAADPRYANGLAYTNLAHTYRSMGKPEEADKVVERLGKVNADWAAQLRATLGGR